MARRHNPTPEEAYLARLNAGAQAEPDRQPLAAGASPAPLIDDRGVQGRGALGVLLGAVALLALVALLLVLLFTPVVGGGLEAQREADAVADAEGEAVSAAEAAAATILAYDHTRLEEGKQAAMALMTPAFAEKYTQTFDSVVAEPATKLKARVTSEVGASGVLRSSEDKVKVLLFVDQTTVSTADPEPQVALNRVEMVMEQRDGRWLVDDISSY